MLQAMRREELRALSIKELKIRIKKLQAASDGAKLDDNGKVALATAEMVLDNKMDQLKLMEANLTNSTAGLRNQLYNMNEQELKDAYGRCLELQKNLVHQYIRAYLDEKDECEEDDEDHGDEIGMVDGDKMKRHLEVGVKLPDIADVFQSAANVTVPPRDFDGGDLRASMNRRERSH